MHGSVAHMWRIADETGKLDLLTHALKSNTPVDVDLLDADREEMDRLAAKVGLIPVFVTTVDAAGQSCQTPGVVSPALVSQYPGRKLSLQRVMPTNRIHWAYLEKVGMPPREVCFTGSPEALIPRKFLVRGDYEMATAYVLEDGSGFDVDMAETVTAWAIIEGF